MSVFDLQAGADATGRDSRLSSVPMPDVAAEQSPPRHWWISPSTPPPTLPRKVLVVELIVVFVVTLGLSSGAALLNLVEVLNSRIPPGVNVFILTIPGHSTLAVTVSIVYLIIHVGGIVGLVAYILSRSGESLKTLGFSWAPRRDIGLLLPFGLLALSLQHFGYLLPMAGQPPTVSSGVGTFPVPAAYAVTGVLRSIEAGIVEEVVVLGFVITRLRQLGVHPVLVIAISALLRASYHIEYGWAAAGPLLFGVGMGIAYMFTRRLMPAIVVHAGYDIWALFQDFHFF